VPFWTKICATKATDKRDWLANDIDICYWIAEHPPKYCDPKSLPAWIAQALIVVLGGAYLIYRAMKTDPGKAAFKRIWLYIEDCSKTAKESTDQLKEETKDLSDDEKKDLKTALEKQLNDVLHENALYTGGKGKVAEKLRALIGAL
jgi:hypothetical protein